MTGSRHDVRNGRAARDAKILKLHQQGVSYAVISERFGLTRSRVMMICRKARRSDSNALKPQLAPA